MAKIFAKHNEVFEKGWYDRPDFFSYFELLHILKDNQNENIY